MKQFLIIFILAIAVPLLWGVGILWVDSAVAQAPTPTIPGIYGVLLDQNALIYCQIVRQTIPNVFQTASAVKSPTPTATTISLQTPIWITPAATSTLATPTIDTFTATPTTNRMYVKIAALNVRSSASTTAAIRYVVTQGQAVSVTQNTVTAGGYQWRQLTDGNWLVEKRLSDEAIWLSTAP